jgi:SagB-type dehydrogenase family enzyme
MLSINRFNLSVFSFMLFITAGGTAMAAQDAEIITLPPPRLAGDQSLESLLQQRRSVRAYSDEAMSLEELGQLLWAAQGITHSEGLRTAPSAGALYPLELFLVVGHVKNADQGIYHYDPKGHRLRQVAHRDIRQPLAQAALSQSWVREAAAVLVFTAVVERTTVKYGQRGIRYVHMEVGHAAQNVFLQAEALGVATVVVGAFDEQAVIEVLDLPSNMQPFMLMPLGKR